MDDDDFSFDFETKLEEQRKQAGREGQGGAMDIPADAAIPVNQSAGSFQRNYRQVINWICSICKEEMG